MKCVLKIVSIVCFRDSKHRKTFQIVCFQLYLHRECFATVKTDKQILNIRTSIETSTIKCNKVQSSATEQHQLR